MVEVSEGLGAPVVVAQETSAFVYFESTPFTLPHNSHESWY